MPSGADHQVLLSIPFVGHGCRLRACGEFCLPELPAGVRIECAQVRVERSRAEGESGGTHNGPTEID